MEGKELGNCYRKGGRKWREKRGMKRKTNMQRIVKKMANKLEKGGKYAEKNRWKEGEVCNYYMKEQRVEKIRRERKCWKHWKGEEVYKRNGRSREEREGEACQMNY